MVNIKLLFPSYYQIKCSVGPATSISEIEKLKAQLPFPREDFSFPRSDSCQTERSEDEDFFL